MLAGVFLLVWVLETLVNLVFQGLQATVTLKLFLIFPTEVQICIILELVGWACGSSSKTTVSLSTLSSRGNKHTGM